MGKHFVFSDSKGRETLFQFPLTESTCLVLFVQTLVTYRPEYLQRSDVRQSKQDRLFRLIRVLIVIDLLSFLQTEVQEYFYHFTVEQPLPSDCFGSAETI